MLNISIVYLFLFSIMGLGFEGLSLGNAETVFKNAMDQGMVKEGVFAFALGDNKEGELTFGGVGE